MNLVLPEDCKYNSRTVRWEGLPVDKLIAFVRDEYVLRGQTPLTGAQSFDPNREDEMPVEWVEWAKKTFDSEGFGPVVKYKWWVSIFGSESSIQRGQPQWLNGFPHRHGWDHGMTLFMMLQPGESGGETVLIEDDGTHHELSLGAGDGVLIDGRMEHGVRPIHGKNTDRIALISTAFLEKE